MLFINPHWVLNLSQTTYLSYQRKQLFIKCLIIKLLEEFVLVLHFCQRITAQHLPTVDFKQRNLTTLSLHFGIETWCYFHFIGKNINFSSKS